MHCIDERNIGIKCKQLIINRVIEKAIGLEMLINNSEKKRQHRKCLRSEEFLIEDLFKNKI
jgi:hypothetical protein